MYFLTYIAKIQNNCTPIRRLIGITKNESLAESVQRKQEMEN